MQDVSYLDNWFIPSKIEPERPNIKIVDRPRLIEELTDALSNKLILVIAPAGFGKSSLVSQWREKLVSEGVACPWFSLDENDFEGRQFLSYITLALANAGLDMEEMVVGAKNGFSDTSERVVIRRLITEIEMADMRCVLILDDYHRVCSPQIDALIKQLIKETPRSFSILINSRTVPDIDCATLIASGLAVELGTDNLRLTKDEAIEAIDSNLSETDFSSLYDKTEGWPVAVQLAKLGSGNLRDFSAGKLGNSNNFIASYLTEQVVDALDDEEKNFLLYTSTLERFNESLVNHVLENDNAWMTMEKLSALTAFIIPMDKEGSWYRYHHLFGEYLYESLRKSAPAVISGLCLRASEWHLQNGQPIEATSYAARVKEYGRCADIITGLGGWKIILTQGIGFMRKLLRFIPETELQNFPRVAIARTYLYSKDGELQQARFLFDATSWQNRSCSDTEWLQDHLLVGQLLGIYQDIIPNENELAALMEQTTTELHDIDSLSLGTLKCTEINSLFANGRLKNIETILESAFMLMRQGGSVLGLNYCYVHACVAALFKCDFENADVQTKMALELAENNFGADSGLKYLVSTLKFAITVWSGRADKNDLKVFMTSLADLEEHDGWAEIYMTGLDAGYHLAAANSEWATAYAMIERYESVAAIRELTRLKQFCLVLKCEVEFKVNHMHNARYIANKLKEMPTEYPWPKNWQSHVLSVIKLSSLQMESDDVTEEKLLAIAQKTDLINANFHHVRLITELCNFYLRQDKREKIRTTLTQLVELCADYDFFWPFQFNPPLKSALYSMRDTLNLPEGGKGLVFVDKFLSGQFENHGADQLNILSLRERQVLTHLAHGMSNKAIAIQLDLTDNTVKFHLKNIYTKLSVSRRGEAVFEAKRMGLL
ncbi:helix-turn-helix transcriptional regulator [Kordiimonas pumila]|uniref:LuxR C-terminal-related transcriptional regulator n=1 Tax=Kordiimonas pumila TaxID=2161677 RepID=A0ABV7D596_9PROT|nr:LuxR C-terminal-related transcriptional regulator [Kordiimonas pumila]